MNAAILCVGKLREKCFFAAAEEYQKRLSRFGRLEVVELPDLPEPPQEMIDEIASAHKK